MVKRLLYQNDEDGEKYNKMPSVSDFDLIIVDEAHRGYILSLIHIFSRPPIAFDFKLEAKIIIL